MSLHVNFEPHAWYMGAAIKDCRTLVGTDEADYEQKPWEAYMADGNTYNIIEFEADTLRELRAAIKNWHTKRIKHERWLRREAR